MDDGDRGRRLPVHLELDLTLQDPLVGSLRHADGTPQEFTGWLDLLAALDAARNAARTEAEASSAAEG